MRTFPATQAVLPEDLPVTGPTSDRDTRFAKLLESHSGLVLTVALLAMLFWTALYLQFTVDDAYISFRYAKVLVANHVWNWNPSGARVESYTSATYTALAILPEAMHLPVALFMKLVGLVCVGWMLYRLRTMALSRFAWVLGLLIACLNPWVWLHAYAGLETPLYMALILELAICVKDAETASPAYLSLILLLLPLTRPEGTVFALAGLVLFCKRKSDWSKVLPWVAGAVLLGVAYFIARWRYFQHLLPNPFYVKVAHASVANLAANLGKSKEYLLTLVLVLILARKTTTKVFAGCSLLLMLALFEPREMPMNYCDRFYFQMVFPIVILFFLAESVDRLARIAAFTGGLFLAGVGLGWLPYSLAYFPYLESAHLDLGRRLAPFAKDHTLLIGDAGAVPYYSNWVTYDFLGLCTNVVAQEGVTPAFLQRIQPDLVVLYSTHAGPQVEDGPADPKSPGHIVLQYTQDSNRYEYAGAARWKEFYLVEFLKKDTPNHDAVLQALQANTESSAAMHLSMEKLLEQQYVPWHR